MIPEELWCQDTCKHMIIINISSSSSTYDETKLNFELSSESQILTQVSVKKCLFSKKKLKTKINVCHCLSNGSKIRFSEVLTRNNVVLGWQWSLENSNFKIAFKVNYNLIWLSELNFMFIGFLSSSRHNISHWQSVDSWDSGIEIFKILHLPCTAVLVL